MGPPAFFMNHLVLAELLQKAGVASASQNNQVLGSLGNVSTNVSEVAFRTLQVQTTVSEVAFRVLSAHSTISDVDSRMATLNATASLTSSQLRDLLLTVGYMRYAFASGASLFVAVNSPVGANTIIPAPGVNQHIKIHSIEYRGAVFHANPSRRAVIEEDTSAALLAIHVGASNAANAGVCMHSMVFTNPLKVRANTGINFTPATGWTVQGTLSIVASRGTEVVI